MSNTNNGIQTENNRRFFPGGGNMRSLLRGKDWNSTPLGATDEWPVALRLTVDLVLDNPVAMCVAWGPEYIQVYNDAFDLLFGPLLAEGAMGGRMKAVFSRIWDRLGPVMEKVVQGQSVRETRFMVSGHMNGTAENRFFDIAFSPVRNEVGAVGGILLTVVPSDGTASVEDELREVRERMRHTTQEAEIATWVFDPLHGTFIADPLLMDWFGLPPSEQFPLSMAMDRLVPADREPVQKAIEQALQPSSGRIDHECTIVHPLTKRTRIIRVKGKAEFNDEGTAYKLYGILQDITAETLAQRKIRESMANFMNMVMQAPFAMAVLRGREHLVEVVNDRALNLWQRKRDEVMGKPILEVMPELLDQGIGALLDEVFDSGRTFSATEMPVQIRGPEGLEERFINFNYQPLLNSEGIAEAILAIGVNVTDLVRSRHQAEESEIRLRSIVENSPFPIGVYTGREMIIQVANQTMLATWGKGYDVIGKKYADVLPELHNQQVFEQLEKVYETGIPFHARHQKIDLVIHGRQETFYFNYSFTPMFNIKGEVYGVMNTAADITDLVHAMQKAEKSEEQLRIALSGGELGSFDFYPREKKLIWSSKTKELFGLPPEAEITLDTYLTAIHENDAGDPHAVLRNVFPLDEGGLYELEYRVVGITDGKPRWLKSKGKATFDADGVPVRYTGVVQEITKLKEAEAETRQLTDILESSQEFIALVRTNRSFSYINPAGLGMLGWKESAGRSLLDCIYPEDAALANRLLESLAQEGSFHHEIRFINAATGQPFWLQWNMMTIRNHQDREIIAFGSVSPNITERKTAEEALRESEERFRTMADNISQLAWMTDETGWIFWYNKRWFEYTGTTLQEMEGWGWKKVHHPGYGRQVERAFRKCIEEGRVWEDTFPLRSASGEYRWFLSRAVPIRNRKGEVIRWFGTNTDITERVKTEQELKESESRFRLFADSMPQIVWAGDAEGKPIYINKSFYNFTGLQPSDDIFEQWISIIHPDDREQTLQRWQESTESGKEFTMEHRFRDSKGEYRWQLSRAVPVLDGNHELHTWVSTSTDIQQIKELDQQKDHFISIASHELKTPVTSIKGYVQILDSMYRETDDAFLKKSLGALDRQIEKLTRLISDLLDLSKLKVGNLHLTKEYFNMNHLIEEVVKEMRMVKQDYTIELDLHTDAELYADKERIAQVLINFLTNAIKYSPRNKLVRVHSVLEHGHFLVTVKDQGIGISKQSQEKIFERFYRVEGINEKTYPGFGIGLFISSEIIQRHKGRIGVKSNPGEGAEFFFSLPPGGDKELKGADSAA